MPELSRVLAAALVLMLYVGLCARIAWVQRSKRLRRQKQAATLSGNAASTARVTVAYASQTGCAEELAWQTAQQLQQAGLPAQVLPLSALTLEAMIHTPRLLLIASTSGEGDAPDNAISFVQALQAAPALALQDMRYGLLALGDATYRQFCGFGRALDQRLQQQGAQALFARIDVNQLDKQALQDWTNEVHTHLLADTPTSQQTAEHSPTHVFTTPIFGEWTLAQRQHLNPGSAGEPVFLVSLQPHGRDITSSDWEAGDLALIQSQASGQAREYSIASIPQDGVLEVIVRQRRLPDGSLGLVSGWLTQQGQIGSPIPLRLRRNTAFRLGDNLTRPMILIGNGTGIAGLRAHLKTRALTNAGPNWLLFGERSARHDALCRQELLTWQKNGLLSRLDLAYSRDQAQKVYVQDKVEEATVQLREWVARGSSIYICGNRHGMAAGVDLVLQKTLGKQTLQALQAQGRYRRDVY